MNDDKKARGSTPDGNIKVILGDTALTTMIDGLEASKNKKNFKGSVENMYKEFFVLNQNKSDRILSHQGNSFMKYHRQNSVDLASQNLQFVNDTTMRPQN